MPIDQETSPVPDEEFVLRRIHKNHVDPGPPVVIGLAAFRPTPEDSAGLSVYREKHVSPADVDSSARKPGEYYVARLSVRQLRQLRLNVIEDEQPQGPAGHALIPELSLSTYQQDKPKSRELQVRLAELAGQDIVFVPTS
jgi:hypothetical protein